MLLLKASESTGYEVPWQKPAPAPYFQLPMHLIAMRIMKVAMWSYENGGGYLIGNMAWDALGVIKQGTKAVARCLSNSALFQNEDLSAGKHCDFVTARLVWLSATTSFQKCLKPQWLQTPTLLIPAGMQELHCLPPLHYSLILAGNSRMNHAGGTSPQPLSALA